MKKLLLCNVFILSGLIQGCPISTDSIEEEPDPTTLNMSFTTECELLTCTVDVSQTVSNTDNLDSVLCSMGDGIQIDPINGSEIIFQYNYVTPGDYNITCTVMDQSGDTDSSTIVVSVDGLAPNAGPDQTVTSGDRVDLDGSASSDTATGDPINGYRWLNAVSNPGNLGIQNSNSVDPYFFAPQVTSPTMYIIELRISTDNGISFSENLDTVTITVLPAPDGPTDL